MVRGHVQATYCVEFDRSAHIFVTGSDDKLVKVWSADNARLIMSLRGHEGDITDISIDPDNLFVASGSNDNVVRVWSLRDFSPAAVLLGHTESVTSVSFSPSPLVRDRVLLTTSLDGTARLWWVDDFEQPIQVQRNSLGRSLSQSQQQQQQIMGTARQAPKVVRCVVFEPRDSLPCEVLCAGFNHNGTQFVTGCSDFTARVWPVQETSGDCLWTLRGHENVVHCALYSNQSDRLLTASWDGTARVWNLKDQSFIPLNLQPTTPIAVLPTQPQQQPNTNNARRRRTASRNGTAPSYSAAATTSSGSAVVEQQMSTPVRLTMALWSADDARVITALSDFTIKVWDSKSGELEHTLLAHSNSVYVLDRHPNDPRVIMSAGYDGVVALWDITQGTIIKICLLKKSLGWRTPPGTQLYDGHFGRDGSFAVSDHEGRVLLYGTGPKDRFLDTPREQFFETDYHPLMRDINQWVIDENLQIPPHLMPRPLLCTIEGYPYKQQPAGYSGEIGSIAVDQGEYEVDRQRMLNEGPDANEPVTTVVNFIEEEPAEEEIPEESDSEFYESETEFSDVPDAFPSHRSGVRKSLRKRKRATNSDDDLNEPLSEEEQEFLYHAARSYENEQPVMDLERPLTRLRQRQLQDEQSSIGAAQMNGAVENDEISNAAHAEQSLVEADLPSSRSSVMKQRLVTRRRQHAESREQRRRRRESRESGTADRELNSSGRARVRNKRIKAWSRWLTTRVPVHDLMQSYIPQVMDAVHYFRQGHEAYIRKFPQMRHPPPPWDQFPNLTDGFICRVKKIDYTNSHYGIHTYITLEMMDQDGESNPAPAEDSIRPIEAGSGKEENGWDGKAAEEKGNDKGKEKEQTENEREQHDDATPKDAQQRQQSQQETEEKGKEKEKEKGKEQEEEGHVDRASSEPQRRQFVVCYHPSSEPDFLILKRRFDAAMNVDFDQESEFEVFYNVGPDANAQPATLAEPDIVVTGDWHRGRKVASSPVDPESHPESYWECLLLQWPSAASASSTGAASGSSGSSSSGGSASQGSEEGAAVTEWADGETSRASPWEVRKCLDFYSELPADPFAVPAKVYDELAEGVELLMKEKFSTAFAAPVSISQYPDYPRRVYSPIDLGTITHRLRKKYYRNLYAVEDDMRRIGENAEAYNDPGTPIVFCSQVLVRQMLLLLQAQGHHVEIPEVEELPIAAEEAAESDEVSISVDSDVEASKATSSGQTEETEKSATTKASATEKGKERIHKRLVLDEDSDYEESNPTQDAKDEDLSSDDRIILLDEDRDDDKKSSVADHADSSGSHARHRKRLRSKNSKVSTRDKGSGVGNSVPAIERYTLRRRGEKDDEKGKKKEVDDEDGGDYGMGGVDGGHGRKGRGVPEDSSEGSYLEMRKSQFVRRSARIDNRSMLSSDANGSGSGSGSGTVYKSEGGGTRRSSRLRRKTTVKSGEVSNAGGSEIEDDGDDGEYGGGGSSTRGQRPAVRRSTRKRTIKRLSLSDDDELKVEEDGEDVGEARNGVDYQLERDAATMDGVADDEVGEGEADGIGSSNLEDGDVRPQERVLEDGRRLRIKFKLPQSEEAAPATAAPPVVRASQNGKKRKTKNTRSRRGGRIRVSVNNAEEDGEDGLLDDEEEDEEVDGMAGSDDEFKAGEDDEDEYKEEDEDEAGEEDDEDDDGDFVVGAKPARHRARSRRNRKKWD